MAITLHWRNVARLLSGLLFVSAPCLVGASRIHLQPRLELGQKVAYAGITAGGAIRRNSSIATSATAAAVNNKRDEASTAAHGSMSRNDSLIATANTATVEAKLRKTANRSQLDEANNKSMTTAHKLFIQTGKVVVGQRCPTNGRGSEEKDMGCALGCYCGWHQQCYPKSILLTDREGGSQSNMERVQLGKCELSVPVLMGSSMLIFMVAIALIVAARLYLLFISGAADLQEPQYALPPRRQPAAKQNRKQSPSASGRDAPARENSEPHVKNDKLFTGSAPETEFDVDGQDDIPWSSDKGAEGVPGKHGRAAYERL
eukprot:gnl/TRDRNA2_/TRDRNA2_171992_c1_seq1.p1 gnl/TRDRNA2_/TRDRNA2_171992_c1~~gnl/TRDRNA2_/TRDRNA2_171992_c1_seq1.p1  ORF type:complete len:316 (-),score=45.20 gnl/TRDRNA2_/TRDRNA2_171992_c1_seq1:40-987(-)